MKNLHGNHLLNQSQTICCSHFGHPHSSKLCGRSIMMQEVLDAENEVSQATDDDFNMNIGDEEPIGSLRSKCIECIESLNDCNFFVIWNIKILKNS
jgi:hypothetical protein